MISKLNTEPTIWDDVFRTPPGPTPTQIQDFLEAMKAHGLMDIMERSAAMARAIRPGGSPPPGWPPPPPLLPGDSLAQSLEPPGMIECPALSHAIDVVRSTTVLAPGFAGKLIP